MGVLDYHYLGQDVLRGFDSYRYSCQDTSPLSKYVMHPFWNLVVKLCPRWVAPNLLTFVGFLCCIGHFAVAAGFDYSYTASTSAPLNASASSPELANVSGISVALHSPIPSPAWFVISILLFLAHTLDGIDGKQARRTGSSSPLGELFDHGCDAWSTLFIATTIYSVFGRNIDGFSIPVFRMYLLLWTVFFMFHFAHVEKYNTGILYLPWAYDLSMLGGTLLYLYVGIMGFQVFKFNVGGLSSGTIAEIIVYIGGYMMALPMAMYNIVQSYRSGTGKMRPLLEAVRPLISLGIAFFVATLWATLSHNNILERDPRAFFIALGSIYANMSCRLIVAQMSNTRCELINYLLVPLTAAAAVSLFVPAISSTYELVIVYLLAAGVTAAHLHYVICVVRQMCQHLKIDCFRIRSSGAERQKDS